MSKKNEQPIEALKATLICEKCGKVHYISRLTEKWYTCPCGQEMRGREKADKEPVEVICFEQPAASIRTVKATSEATISHGATKIAYSHYEASLASLKSGKTTRKQLIAEVVELGVHKGTASVQWCKFAKANNI